MYLNDLYTRFKYLAHVTGDQSWWDIAERPMSVVRQATFKSNSDGLLPIFLNPITGDPFISEIRLGSRGDSYYEYLIKQFVQTNCSESVYLEMYQRAMSGIKSHLLKQSPKQKLLFTAEIHPRMYQGSQKPVFVLMPKQDHLVCFLGGSSMLGALHVQENGIEDGKRAISFPPSTDLVFSALSREDWSVGHELIKTCVETYTGTNTGLSPEIAMFRLEHDSYTGAEEDWYIKRYFKHRYLFEFTKDLFRPTEKMYKEAQSRTGKLPEPLIDSRNILRPETVESLFIAFHLSGDIIYREWGWKIFQAFLEVTRVPGNSRAFASIRDVNATKSSVEFEDRMET